MRTPTAEQQAVLDCASRVRIVCATPGSGKTWLVAELIRQELDKWQTRTSGIAALSFTRVGGDEIRKALGYELTHPHFVGTIDAFLFRYVVRPFLRCCFPWFGNPRLIPGEWGAEHWSKYGSAQVVTVDKKRTINLFGCVFVDEDQGKAVVAHKPHPRQPLKRLVGGDLRKVRDGKKQLWERSGCLTHSDAALWASKILEHQSFGCNIRAEIVRRFPLLIVDELQDTGYFLGKSIRLLLAESTVHGMLVGDPDQAIFEFSGARPDLFNSFESIEGAVALPLANSLRCPSAVVEAAKHVKDSPGKVGPAEERKGRAILVRYDDMRADISRIVKLIVRWRAGGSVKIVARSNQTIEVLVGRRSESPPKLRCPALNHMHRAVIAFRQGRQVAALAAARAALDVVIFQHEGVSDEELNGSNLDPRAWKMLAVRSLLGANALAATGSVFDWQKAVGEILDEELVAFGLDPSLGFAPGHIRPQKHGDWEKASVDCLPQLGVADSWLMGVPVRTVHGVKGETHDATIFVCPESGGASRCPSTVWWSADTKDREERRIAYVAMTRTQGDLILCVPRKCYQRLAARRSEFTASFKCVTVAECVLALDEG